MATITRKTRIQFDMSTDPREALRPASKGTVGQFFKEREKFRRTVGQFTNIETAAWYNGVRLSFLDLRALNDRIIDEIEVE